MPARSFLIKSSSKLLVTGIGIKARTGLISGQIRLLTSELLDLEWRKFYTFEIEYLWGPSANLDQILCVASLGVWKGCIMFWGRLDQNSGVHGNRKPPLTHWHIMGKMVSPHFARLLLIRSFLARLYVSTGRAIAVTTASASLSASASALLKMLKFLVKVFKSLYLLNPWMGLVDTLPDVRYWSEVLCCTLTTHIGHLEVKVTDFEILN